MTLTKAELADLPTEAAIRLEGGSVLLRLLPDVAPVTIARFASLANGGFYNDQIFHRVVPNFVAQQQAIRNAPTLRDDAAQKLAPLEPTKRGIEQLAEPTRRRRVIDLPAMDPRSVGKRGRHSLASIVPTEETRTWT